MHGPQIGDRLLQPARATDADRRQAVELERLFKALADRHRVRIVNLLAGADEAVCVCKLMPALGLAQPTVSYHLKLLVDAGLLERERRGRFSYYRLTAARSIGWASSCAARSPLRSGRRERAVRVRAERRPLADGRGALRSGWRRGHKLVRGARSAATSTRRSSRSMRELVAAMSRARRRRRSLTATPHRLERSDAEWADVVVHAWAAATPARTIPGKRYLDWELDDPAGKDLAETRTIRDEIGRTDRAPAPRAERYGGDR